MEKVYVGKIVNTFGIKGELKIASRFEMAEKVFQKGQKILLNNEVYQITSVRYHKKHYLVVINDLDNINLVLKYKGLAVFILKDSLELKEEEYLMSDLINLEVYDNNSLIGTVTEVVEAEANPLIKVNNQFYIPLKANYIKIVDIKNERIDTENIKELML